MAELSELAWALIGVISGVACLASLGILAANVRDETAVCELRAEATKMRNDYLAHIKAMQDNDGDSGGVEILSDEEAAQIEQLAAA